MTAPDAAVFARRVRDALAHLYDPVYLQTHPLVAALGVADRAVDSADSGGGGGARRAAAGRVLRRRLLDAVARLRPEAKAGEADRAGRMHRLLELRYVEALAPPAVQAQLGLAKSQYHREHARALRAVVSLLEEERAGRAGDRSSGGDVGTAAGGGSPDAGAAARLPAPLTSFVGRVRELTEVVTLLTRHRLVTLTGPGGAGKTRLALKAAAAVAGRFPDGVAFVDLAPIADPALVPATVARACGVRESGDRPPLDLLRAHLRRRRQLVVADNLEHLLPAGPVLAGLLPDAPGLTLLATSRAPLRVGAEQEYPVPPLEVPAVAAAPVSDDALLHADAVRLFVERARQARPDLTLRPDEAAVVASLCRRLDGLPLPIELAASHVRYATPDDLLTRLEPRLLLHAAGVRDAPARHRTLAAMLDWSHDLLSDAEQTLFRRLGVFAGGWTLEAAAAVCAGGALRGPAPDGVFAVLAGLVDQSLVVVGQQDGTTRYRLLETVREYALHRLDQAGEAVAVRQRHLRWYRRLAEAWDGAFFGPGQAERLAGLVAELDNLRAALDWGVDGPRCPQRDAAARAAAVDDGLRLAAALRWFWVGVGIVQEARERTGALLAPRPAGGVGESAAPGPERRGRAAARAGALGAAAHLAFVGGDFAEVEARLRESLPLWRRAGDERGLALALAYLGMVVRYRLDLDQAEAILLEARETAARSGGRLARYWAAHGLGLVRRARGDGAGAVALDEEALALAETEGDPGHAPVSRILLASSLQVAGDLPRARRMLVESLECADEFGAQLAVVPRLVGFATLAAREGQPERALRLAGAVAALRARTGATFSAATAAFDPALAAAAQTLGEAAAGAALAAGQAMSIEQAVADALRTAAPSRTARPLTGREREVAALAAGGLSDRQIAERLGISERTAENHVRHILAKLGARSRDRIAAWAAVHGLTGPHRPPPQGGRSPRESRRGRDRSA